MELIIYDRPFAPRDDEPKWRPRWLAEFERWAAPTVAPEREEEQERSFVAVGILLALALAMQYLQLGIPAVWGLFVLLLLALRVKEDRLAAIGFPALDARRIALALGLVGFFLGAALVRAPADVAAGSTGHWLLPIWPGERVLFVLLGLTAAIVEETFFRGFAIVWIYRWSRHLPLAVLFPAAVFAAGHAYLSWLNVGFAFLAAVGFSVLFLWRRELYWPMVIHFLVDVWTLLV
jgi:membrane protease YdiL (CAAX protease family)